MLLKIVNYIILLYSRKTLNWKKNSIFESFLKYSIHL